MRIEKITKNEELLNKIFDDALRDYPINVKVIPKYNGPPETANLIKYFNKKIPDSFEYKRNILNLCALAEIKSLKELSNFFNYFNRNTRNSVDNPQENNFQLGLEELIPITERYNRMNEIIAALKKDHGNEFKMASKG